LLMKVCNGSLWRDLHSDPLLPFDSWCSEGRLSGSFPPFISSSQALGYRLSKLFSHAHGPEALSQRKSLHNVQLHDAIQFIEALSEKSLEQIIADLLREGSCLVMKGIMHCPVADGLNALAEIDWCSA